MADHFTGKNMVLEFGSDDISAAARRVTISEVADPPEDVDFTHKGDTQRQIADGLPGAIKTTVTIEALDETGQASGIAGLTLNTQDTLTFYPEGKEVGLAVMTLDNTTFRGRDQTTPYDEAATLTATFDSKLGCTWSTYTTP